MLSRLLAGCNFLAEVFDDDTDADRGRDVRGRFLGDVSTVTPAVTYLTRHVDEARSFKSALKVHSRLCFAHCSHGSLLSH
jgi:hypothetical protein